MAKLDKIRWQCRRGMLELDLVLEKFNQQHLDGLETGQIESFKELLAFADNDLLDLIMGRTAAPDQRYVTILRLLRTA